MPLNCSWAISIFLFIEYFCHQAGVVACDIGCLTSPPHSYGGRMCGCSMLIFAGWRSFPGGLLLGAERGGRSFNGRVNVPLFIRLRLKEEDANIVLRGIRLDQ